MKNLKLLSLQTALTAAGQNSSDLSNFKMNFRNNNGISQQ
jgi:hypothetical protein